MAAARKIVLATLVLLAAMVALVAGVRLAIDRWTTGAIHKVQIHPHIEDEGDSAWLSPHGSKVLLLRSLRQKGGLGDVRVFTLEAYDARTATLLSTTSLPGVKSETPEYDGAAMSQLSFCDDGKYILAHLGSDNVAVLDAQTFSVHAQFTFPRGNQGPPRFAVMSGACAANSALAAFAFASPNRAGVIRVFDLDRGAQTGVIALEATAGQLWNLDVSPSGRSAAILSMNGAGGSDVTILALDGRSVARTIHTAMAAKQVVFVGDSTVAVGSGWIRSKEFDSRVHLFDVKTGAEAGQFGARWLASGAPLAASEDGRRLLAYTGVETVDSGGRPQIETARFTVWDTATGRIETQSAAFSVLTTPETGEFMGAFLPFHATRSWRPALNLSQAGNAAIVRSMDTTDPIDVYTFGP